MQLPLSDRGVTSTIWCGVLAPPLFAVTVIAVGALQPRYDPLQQGISILGSAKAGAPGMAMNAFGFVGIGSMLLAFSLGLITLSRTRQGARGALCLAAASIGLVSAGFVPLPNFVHILISAMTTLLTALGIHGMRLEVAEIARERWLTPVSWGVAAFIVGVLGLLWVIPKFAGLVQRASVGAAMIWIEGVALLILRAPMSRPSRSGACA